MRLINFLTMICAMFLITGCFPWMDQTPTVEDDEVNFCEVEERRLFTQEELDVRAERFPANLRRDFKTNRTFDRECVVPAVAE